MWEKNWRKFHKIARKSTTSRFEVSVCGGDNMAALNIHVCVPSTTQFDQNHPRIAIMSIISLSI